jgi:cobalt-zinc-cadmium efflux system membrane fusion protein
MEPNRPESRSKRILRGLPTLLILAAMGALAWAGHSTGWRAPRFSTLFGGSTTVSTEDWCSTHNVPASTCVACRPELTGGSQADWCREHGVAESECTICHPEIRTGAAPRDWCGEHGVPESQCNLCHPETALRGEPLPSESPRVSLEETAADPSTCRTHALRVQFASEAAIAKAGVRLASIVERPLSESIEAPGESQYHPARVARVSSRAAGLVWRVDHSLGDPVKRGELLALVDSFEVGRAREALLLASATRDARLRTLERIRAAAGGGLRTRGELEEAEAEARVAEIQFLGATQGLLNLGLDADVGRLAGFEGERLAEEVRFLGLEETARKTLGADVRTGNLIAIPSPLDGIVVSRDVAEGEAVESAKTLFVVADPTRLSLHIDLRLEDAPRIAKGQPVSFLPDGGDQAFRGSVNWIGVEVDPKTRTLQVRAEIENPEGSLRVNSFGTARIRVRESPKAAVLPLEAIQWEGCCHVVFVRESPTVFRVRKVRLGTRLGDEREVLAGASPGEVVVAAGSAVLKSEILKHRLGAGCAGE